MAEIFRNSFIFSLTIYIILSLRPCQATSDTDEFLVKVDQILVKEKLSHFRVYWHDILSGNAPTAVRITRPAARGPYGFGTVTMIDNRLTLQSELSSKTIGKAQGFYASASQEDLAFLMAMNFVFTEEKHNGSTITIVGRNEISNQVREMPVIGGSGFFQFASGYVQAPTHTFDLRSGDATIQYDVYVKHY